MRLLLSLLANTAALFITDYLLTGLTIVDLKTTFLAAIVLGLVNTFIRPILLFLTAPLNFLSLGLFTFVINAVMLYLVSLILGPAFVLENFLWALFAAAVLAVVSTVLSTVIKDITK
jgi:putative membrane protein